MVKSELPCIYRVYLSQLQLKYISLFDRICFLRSYKNVNNNNDDDGNKPNYLFQEISLLLMQYTQLNFEWRIYHTNANVLST